MAYYVSIQDHGRSVLALGPFNRHGDALARVEAVRRHVHDAGYREAPWCGYGTAHHKTGRPVGKLNAALPELLEVAR